MFDSSYWLGLATGLLMAGVVMAICYARADLRRRDKKSKSLPPGWDRWGAISKVNIFTENAQTSAPPARTLADYPPPPPKGALRDYGIVAQVDKHTQQKTLDILRTEKGSRITGFIIALENHVSLARVVVELGAVRWMDKQVFWDTMHPSNIFPKPAELPAAPANWLAIQRITEDLSEAAARTSDATDEQVSFYCTPDGEIGYQEKFDFTKIRSVRDTIADLKELVDLTVWQQDTVDRAAIWLSGLAEVDDAWWQKFTGMVDILSQPIHDSTRESLIELVSRVVATPVDAH